LPRPRTRARRYIERLDPAGGTNIEAGLEQGLKLLAGAEGRVPMLFFLTDGVPTQGQTDPAVLLRRAADANKSLKARVFSFGLGSDVNTLLLDKLADAGRGARDYAAPGEDIEGKLSALYQKVARPALTEVRLEWKGVEVEQAYPRPVPDLFHGGELALYGRYRAGGKGTLVVTGKAGGKTARFEFPVELPENEDKNDFLPRLWATQKIGHELDAIRLSGRPADPEVVSSIVRLAKKHGIVTPYTSYLVTEEGTDLRQAERAARRRFDALSVAAARSGFSGGSAFGAAAQADSMRMAKMANIAAGVAAVRGAAAPAAPTMALDAMESEARAELRAKSERLVETRAVGGKTFYRRGAAWVDGEAELGAALPKKSVKARSADYFALLAAEPGLAKFLALGDRVRVAWKGTLYEVVTE
jgi:Ca-activated chloride channel homolog